MQGELANRVVCPYNMRNIYIVRVDDLAMIPWVIRYYWQYKHLNDQGNYVRSGEV